MDNVDDNSGDDANCNEEHLITSSPTDICSDSSVTPTRNTSELLLGGLNTNELPQNDSEKECRKICNDEASDSDDDHRSLDIKFCCERVNCTNSNLPQNNLSSDTLSISEESCANELISTEIKSKPVFLSSYSLEETSNVSSCNTFGNGNNMSSVQEKKNQSINEPHVPSDLESLTVQLDKIQFECEKIISNSAKFIKDNINLLHPTVSGPEISTNIENSNPHEQIPDTNSHSLELLASSTKNSYSNNINILPLPSSYFTQSSESHCRQQGNLQTGSLNSGSPSFVNTFKNNDKTKDSFCFPLNSELNFTYKNSSPFFSNYTSSIGLFERPVDYDFKSPQDSMSSAELMSKTSNSLDTIKSNNCSIPSSKMLFGSSLVQTLKFLSNSQTKYSHNSDDANACKNNQTESVMTANFDVNSSFKTQGCDSKKTSSAFCTSFAGCSKNLFPTIVTNTSSVQSSSKSRNEIKNVQLSVSSENNVPSLSFGPSSINTSSCVFSSVSQQSPTISKSHAYTSTSTKKSPLIWPSRLDGIGTTFKGPLFDSSSLDNTQSIRKKCTEFLSSTPFFNSCSTSSSFETDDAKPLFSSPSFGSSIKSDSSEGSITLFNSKYFTNSGVLKSESTAYKKPSFSFGCTSKQNDDKFSFKSNQVDATGSLFGFNSSLFKTTPGAPIFNFGTSSSAGNFDFGSSLATSNNSRFIFKSSNKEKLPKGKKHFKKIKSNFNNIPEIPNIPYRVVRETELCLKNGVQQFIDLHYQSIIIIPEYSDFSFEELRYYYEPLSATENNTFTANTFEISKATQTSDQILSDPQYLADIWKALECPVCFEIVATPVHQCEQGHHVCNNCWRNITSCPLCKRSKKQTRNYMAETILEKLPLPCKYRVEGCMKINQPKDKTAHENLCTYRTYCCLVQGCDKAHSYNDMILHLKNVHKNLMATPESSWKPNSWIFFKYNFQSLVHAFEIPYWGLFFLRHKTSGQNNYLWMQMFNFGTSETGFLSSIEVAGTKEQRSVTSKGPVFSLHAPIIDTQDCLVIPENLLAALKGGHVLQVKISIWKKQL